MVFRMIDLEFSFLKEIRKQIYKHGYKDIK